MVALNFWQVHTDLKQKLVLAEVNPAAAFAAAFTVRSDPSCGMTNNLRAPISDFPYQLIS